MALLRWAASTDIRFGPTLPIRLAVAMDRLMTGLLVGVSSYDPVTFVGGGSFLLLIALLSAWLPSRRASRIDPVTALRSE